MKQNVVLFSLLAIGAVYIWYGSEETPILLEEIELESSSTNPDEEVKPTSFHSRKLLFHQSFGIEPEDIDISSTAIDSFGNLSLEKQSNKIPRSLRVSGKKSTVRRKRRVPNSKEQLDWKFNLNVTRYENVTPKNKIEYPTESKDAYKKSEKDKYLGMSLSVSGNGPDQSVEELYRAWESVGQFLRSLFGGNLEELKNKGHGVSVDIGPLPNGTKDIPVEFFMDGSGDEEFQEGRNRKGKFLLGLFGFGGNSENPPRDEGSGEPLDTQELNTTEVLLDIQSKNTTHDGTDLSNAFESKTDNIEISSVSSTVTTEISNSKESVTSSSNLDELPFTTNPTNINITSSILIGEAVFSEGNCTDCNLETENASTDGKGLNEVSSISLLPLLNTTPGFPFNAEALADFCRALFTRLRKSPQTVERSVGNEGSGSLAIDEGAVKTNTQTSNILTDEPRPQNLGFVERIWNRIWNRRRSVPEQEVMNETRGARLVNIGDLFGEFGSGRSSESGVSSDIEFDNFQSDEDNEQFLSDCEAFLMSVQTDTRPNIFDLIHPHPEEDFSTEFTTLKSEKSQLGEQERVQNLTVGELALDFESTTQSGGPTVIPLISETDQQRAIKDELSSRHPSEIHLTTEAQDKKPLEEKQDVKSFESSTKTEDTVLTEVPEKIQNDSLNVRNLVEENMNVSLEFQSTESSDLSIFTGGVDNELSTEELNRTHLDEQRSFNLFGFGGSGTEELSEEGSSDVSNTNERSFGLFNFGSGEREIKEIDVTLENITESFKERSFFLSFGSGGRLLDVFNTSEWEMEQNSKSTTEGRGRFFALGSGERELKENQQPTTEKSDTQSVSFLPAESFVTPLNKFSEESPPVTSEQINANLKTTSTLEIGETSTECDDSAQNLNDSDVFIIPDTSATIKPVEDSENRICIDCETATQDILAPVSYSGGMFSSISSSSRKENTDEEYEFRGTTVVVQQPFLTNRDNLEKDSSTKGTSETTTLKNDPRLIGTIFLTGSGEGGLFDDNKGPINLVEESEITSPVFQRPPQSGRGARRHDPDAQTFTRPQIERNFKVTEPAPITDAKKFMTSQEPTRITIMSTYANKALDETTEVLDTITENAAFNPTTIEPRIIDETITSIVSLTTLKSVTEVDVTTSGVITTTSQKITPRTKILEFPKRYCSSASQCNRALNERCISTGTTAMCNCGRSYIRSPETGKCESPVVLKTSLKLPGEVFHQDLKNRNSERFQKKRNDSIETMMLLLGDDPDLFRTIAGVEVSGFEEGSLVVHWEITLAPNDTTIPSLIHQVDSELKEAFEDEALLVRAPLNVTNAILMAVTSDMDPCENTQRNYCSKNADCIPDLLKGFICRCKEDYMDKSMDKEHPGEVCIASCPPYYCGDHGECRVKEDGNRHCSCNGWFFGERCEISGIIVIAGFASFNVVLIIVVVTLVCVCKRRRYRQSRFYGQNQVRFQPGAELGRFTASPRLADTIAMDDVGATKASKYMAISTPLHNAPTIQIKSPSIMGSSADYDYESTFDRTPSAGEVSVEVSNVQETHKV